MRELIVGSTTSMKTEAQANTEALAYLLRQKATLSPELRLEYEAHPVAEPFLMVDGAVVNATTWRALLAENAALRKRVAGYCDRIAAQAELLAKRVERPTEDFPP